MNLERLSSGSLVGGGVTLIGMGLYFAFLRPPLLPEDLRYIGASLAELQSAMPALLPWLDLVFGVLGGFIVVAGLMAIYFAATSKGNRAALGVVAFCGLVPVGWMVIVNFAIDSNFKWLLLALALPWAFSLALLAASRLTVKAQT